MPESNNALLSETSQSKLTKSTGSLSKKDALSPHKPLGSNQGLTPQFLVPLGVQSLSILDPTIFSSKNSESDFSNNLFEDSPFFSEYRAATPKHNATKQVSRDLVTSSSTKQILQKKLDSTISPLQFSNLTRKLQRSEFSDTQADFAVNFESHNTQHEAADIEDRPESVIVDSLALSPMQAIAPVTNLIPKVQPKTDFDSFPRLQPYTETMPLASDSNITAESSSLLKNSVSGNIIQCAPITDTPARNSQSGTLLQMPQVLQNIMVLDSLASTRSLSQYVASNIVTQSSTNSPKSDRTTVSGSNVSSWSDIGNSVKSKTTSVQRKMSKQNSSSVNTLIQAKGANDPETIRLSSQHAFVNTTEESSSEVSKSIETLAQAIYEKVKCRLRIQQERHGRGYTGRSSW
ncbi:MAG: hypothetical protein RMY16_11040 [Nostoc sp. DedQUE12b]|uniref:hypothetical protein n=1 Tax=Nostoc sp. DedQUE12b TaxID=3075398 RepID=UPI002AD45BE4|nr:hypothetical protein [Nostoc sp. DedQUE12b]MDZ8086082.1 hypothetical protein [Nostoc sp. DedQUE12b]